MNRTPHDELETHLRELFERQADAIPAHARDWDDVPMATVSTIAAPRRARSAVAAIVATAAAAALVVGVAAMTSGGNGVAVGGQPGVPAPLSFATKQVQFATDGMRIDAGGHEFTAAGSTVDVHSDPGTPNRYTTLELEWPEGGVGMRLYIYFTSDGHDWWANEMRTYNGKAQGDWIEYRDTYFRAPLGHAFTGNVDVASTDGQGRLRLSNLRLQAFLPIAACVNPASPYALNLGYDHADIPKGAGGFGLGIPMLLDTATCTQVTDLRAFEFDLGFTSPGIALIETTHDGPRNAVTDFAPTGGIQLSPKSAGSTILHIRARRRSTGEVVAATDIPVTVG